MIRIKVISIVKYVINLKIDLGGTLLAVVILLIFP